MPDSTPHLPAQPSLEQLKKQAKELLRQYRAGETSAVQRFLAAAPGQFDTALPQAATLANAQYILARELAFESWPALKRHIEAVPSRTIEPYEQLAADVVRACQDAEPGAVERLGELFGGRLTVEQVRHRVWLRLREPGHEAAGESTTAGDARLFVARLYGFPSWTVFAESVEQRHPRPEPSAHGINAAVPPFYRIDWKNNSIEPRPPLSHNDWEGIFEVMRHHRIDGLRAGGQMTDAVLRRVAQLDLVTSLNLDGSRRVTDAGLRHLVHMPRLEQLNLSGCGMTDEGLGVLRELPTLREFYLYHHGGISDEGLANLRFCERIERVDLLGSNSGDGAIRALAGKQRLRHLKSGNGVTDGGLTLLRQFPVFRTWAGPEPELSLMGFDVGHTFLLLRGRLTDRGMADLAGLDGLFALNVDDGRAEISAAGLKHLAALPRLGMLGFDATDETMGAIAALPRIRKLMCQDTSATDAGFAALSRSRTIEHIWGRRCYGLTGAGFGALGKMARLRGLAVSCRNVGDTALAALPGFPALVEFMPMDVPDEGFRHVGACERLEGLWCMGCRDLGDAATAHLARLQRLKTYYAGQTRITDRSLELLGGMQSLERLSFEACEGVTNAGVAFLASLPRLKELSLGLMPQVTRDAIAAFPAHVLVDYEA